LRQAQFEQSAAASRRVGEEAKKQLLERRERLAKAAEALKAMEGSVALGADLSSKVADVDKKRAELESRNQRLGILVSSLREIGEAFAPQKVRAVADVSRLIEELRADLDVREQDLSARLAARNDTLKEIERLSQIEQQIETKNRELASVRRDRENATRALESANAVRETARRLVKQATDTRSALVRSALNDHLNEIWRRLFIRLAPSEPYVPAFGRTLLPGAQVMLETRDRKGNQAGTPGAMLSTGNLNTAALTLFLGLHLSVTPTLPWLLLDDPVQSMDEVHVSQFAALLRSVSKQHERQVIIAVHERPLFDYLALELSPAFESDRLLTLELGRDADDAAAIHPRELSWSRDSAVA
jgi:exonuclease SbcC